nr:MAG TPA: hypothetical protein [Caudoviricetes sp.]
MFANELVINLTQHEPTQDQKEIIRNWVELSDAEKASVKKNLTFRPQEVTKYVIMGRAAMLATLAKTKGAKYAHIGGAPYLMAHLEDCLKQAGITPLYSLTERVTEEKVIDGEVTKTSVFKCAGFYAVE